MADPTLTPAELVMIDAIVDPIRRERAAAPGLAARYDSACDAVTEQYDEIVKLRRQAERLEDQLADAHAEAARESKLVSEARHERDTARQEAREARREAARLITGDRADVLHWAVRQLRATPMPTALTGPYWYGQGWKEAINYLEHDLGGLPTDTQVELVEQAEEIGRLRAQLAATTRPGTDTKETDR